MKRLAALALLFLALPLAVLPVLAAAASGLATSSTAAAFVPCAASGPPGSGDPASGIASAALAAAAARRAGFPGADVVIAVAIAGAESSYDPLARNSIGAAGLWQILTSAHPDLFASYDWRDPNQNAAMAYSVWLAAGRSWRPWTTWTGGAYLRFLPAARAAVTALDSTAASSWSASTVPCTVSTATAVRLAGVSVGCTIPDPSGTGGCVTPALAHLMAQVEATFGHPPVSCWSARGGDPYSDHPKGRACDYTMGRSGAYAAGADLARGWQLALWLRSNAAALHIAYVIWQGRIWSRSHDLEGWRPYTGGGIYDATGTTNGHYDHVHVSTTD